MEPDGTGEPAPDLEYDLAHEGEEASRVAEARAKPEHEHVVVATKREGDDGDYGYDLAHDVPGR